MPTMRILCSKVVLVLTLVTLPMVATAGEQRKNAGNPTTPPPQKLPLIVIYSKTNCPPCDAAKTYFTKVNLPFVNHDVEHDSVALRKLTKKYKSQWVPVIVIGKDRKVLVGFNRETFEAAFMEVMQDQQKSVRK